MGYYDAALASLAHVLATRTGEDEAGLRAKTMFTMGQVCLTACRPEDALEWFTKVMAVVGDDEDIVTQVRNARADCEAKRRGAEWLGMLDKRAATVYRRRGQLDKAVGRMADARAVCKRDANLVLNEAEVLHCMGKYDEAAALVDAFGPDRAATSVHERLMFVYRLKFLHLAGRPERLLAATEAAGDFASLLSEDERATFRSEVVVGELTGMMETEQPLPGTPLVDIVGDSHVLPLAWRRTDDGQQIVAHYVPGLKAFHCAVPRMDVMPDDSFAPLGGLRYHMGQIRNAGRKHMVLVAGEIDARWEEGLGLAVRKQIYPSLAVAAWRTVEAYVSGVDELAAEFALDVKVATVPPARRVLFPELEIDHERASAVKAFNEALRAVFSKPSTPQHVRLLDMEAAFCAMGRDAPDTTFLDGVHATGAAWTAQLAAAGAFSR